MTDAIPSGPGRLILNHWSNGDPNWSGGPPQTDAVMTVSYVKAYFNSSNETRNAEWTRACGDTRMDRTCILPDQTGSIDPTGQDGNVTGKTEFFSLQGQAVNQTVYLGATALPNAGGQLETMRGDCLVTAVAVASLSLGVAVLMC